MDKSPYKIGGFLSSVLLSCETDSYVHSTLLGPCPHNPHGNWGKGRTDVHMKFIPPAVPQIINCLDAFELTLSLLVNLQLPTLRCYSGTP